MKTVFILLTAFLLASCHCEKKTPAKTADTSKPQPATSDEAGALQNLVLSFYSIGSGTNHEAARQFEDFVFNYSEKTKTTIPYQKTAWGREGEIDYCIDLSGWVDDSRNKFISGTRELLKGVQVHIRENSPCREIK